MKVLATFFVLCALIGINEAHFETVFGEIDGHELIGSKKAWVESDPDSTTGMEFTFPQKNKPRTHVITGFKKTDDTDYIPEFEIKSGGIGFPEIVVHITSGFKHHTILATFDFYGDKI